MGRHLGRAGYQKFFFRVSRGDGGHFAGHGNKITRIRTVIGRIFSAWHAGGRGGSIPSGPPAEGGCRRSGNPRRGGVDQHGPA